MTIEELEAFIASKHSPDAAKKPGMVYQVWEDGEVTLQKCGDLLWQRTLHCNMPGLSGAINYLRMPEQFDNRHGYVFVSSREDALLVRETINKFLEQEYGK